MKNQLSFLKGMSIICLSLLLSFFNCSSEVDIQTAEMEPLIYIKTAKMQPPLTDVLTLELTIGGEDLRNEFLLVHPSYICVNDEGDILFMDEQRVKIFNKTGKEKRIIGRPGEGPGEFGTYPILYLSPKEYLTVFDSNYGVAFYNLFAPDYSFINKKRVVFSEQFKKYLDDHEFKSGQGNISKFKMVAAISETEKIINYETIKQDIDSDQNVYELLVYENRDAIKTLINIKQPGTVELITSNSSSIGHIPRLGGLYWGLLPERRIIYVNTDEDIHNEKTGSLYTIHIVSLENFQETLIRHPFAPIPLEFKQIPVGGDRSNKLLENEYKKKKYEASIRGLIVDRYYAFTYMSYNNEEETRLYDVFDVNAGKYLSSVIFTVSPNVIKNGCLYTRYKDEEGFYEIRKYRIDPAVYGK